MSKEIGTTVSGKWAWLCLVVAAFALMVTVACGDGLYGPEESSKATVRADGITVIPLPEYGVTCFYMRGGANGTSPALSCVADR